MMIGPYEVNAIYTGDARELAVRVPDNSLDVIFTDPPYPGEYLPLYGWLAEFGSRALKSGGFLIAYAGSYHLSEVMRLMDIPGLSWYYMLSLISNGNATIVWPRRILSRAKYILMWTKGPGMIAEYTMSNVIQGSGADKRFHRWGQDASSAQYILEYTIGRGNQAIVCDPFMGGGTTAAACLSAGYDYLGFEQDAEAADIARARLSGSWQARLDDLPLFAQSGK